MITAALKRPPDFFLVGAPKSATSSLHLLLLQHPDVFMCSPKEPHFFCTDLPGLAEVNDPRAYDALFENAPQGALLGEASAFYLSSTEAAANIHEANPKARIILSIRNPADAAHSLFHQLRDGFREDQEDFETAWNLQEARANGQNLPSYCPEPAQLQYRAIYSYHDQIQRYFDCFGRDQVMVLNFDDIRQDPDRVIEDLLNFIGLPTFEVAKELPRTNTRRASKYPRLTRFISSPPGFVKPLVAPLKRLLNSLGVKPSEFMMKHMSKPSTAPAARLDTGLRNQILTDHHQETTRLEALLDRDLSSWRPSRDAAR